MRAVVVSSLGGPEQLELTELPDPEPGPGELLVSVAAAGVNFIDTYHRTGLYPRELPFVPGSEGAGTVVSVGPEVSGFGPGDRVAWASAPGSYAELVRVPAAVAVAVPDGVDLATAAAVMLQGMTAHYLATDTFPLGPGHTCLVHAAAGGVGLLLVQIAARRGARVIGTVSTPEKAALARDAGAEVVNYAERPFREAVEELAGPRPCDVVYDGVGRTTFADSLALLRPRGLMVSFGNASGPVDPVSPLVLSSHGSLYLTRPTMGDYLATREELERRAGDLFEWILSGELAVRIGERHPLGEAPEAHRRLEGRRTTGKVILEP